MSQNTENVKELGEIELEKVSGGKHKVPKYRGTNSQKWLIRELLSPEERAVLDSLPTEEEKKKFYADHKDLFTDYKTKEYERYHML